MRRLPNAFMACLTAFLVVPAVLAATQKRALFDNTHQETAGNADWIIDTDQPLPVPSQSTVTQATPRTYWLGAISSYGIDLVKRGYFVATLINSPADSALGITYNNPANKYDLSRYDVFIVPEPNTRFSQAESTAIFNYVRDGGGLIAISDHWNSDRNGDGADSPEIWDYLDRQRYFGVHFDTSGEANNNIIQDSGNHNTSPADSIIYGPDGIADSVSFHNGTTFVLYPGINASVRGELWMNGTAQGSTTNVMAASSVYGNGRIFFIGDSSPVDDGSAQPGNSSIFDGWGEASGRDSILFVNATIWATRRDAGDAVAPSVTVLSPDGGENWPAGSSQTITWNASDNVGVDSVNVDYSAHGAGGPWQPVQHALANTGSLGWTVPIQVSDSALVRVTAFDHALNQGVDASNALFHFTSSPLDAGASPRLRFALHRPWPNPGAGPVEIRFELAEAGEASLEVVDLEGRRVWRSSGALLPGEHVVSWSGRTEDGRDAPAGLYFVRLSSRGRTVSTRMVRLRR